MRPLQQVPVMPAEEWAGPPIAVFWDQSLLWGIICVESLRQLGIPFRLLNGLDIATGALDEHRVVVVPGGWASHKVGALGEAGRARLRQFVEEGGSYLGLCGGAGLALSSPPSLGLVPLKRMPLAERLPSASGEVWIQGVPGHPIWQELPTVLPVCVWWPSQFVMPAGSDCLCLATYEAPGADFWVADLPFSDLSQTEVPWQDFERIYGINLEPTKLLGQPAIVEARRGRGRLILSYPHLDTPDHAWGKRLFLACLRYLDGAASPMGAGRTTAAHQRGKESELPGAVAVECLREAKEATDGLIAFGERHLLWNWRLPWLLNWRRGIRGLEYGTLAVVMTSLLEHTNKPSGRPGDGNEPWLAPAQAVREAVASFCNHAKDLLLEEKLATQTSNLTKLGKVNATVDRLRGELFGNKMHHGGLCRELFDRLDGLLLQVLRG